jgi:hypothetical protein
MPTPVPDVTSVLLVGVGGQGTILASDVLAKVAAASGLDVKLAEVHGMSQRGGSVDTVVRFGDEVFSPVIDPGGADHLIAFELIEAARWIHFLKPGGRLVVNNRVIAPLPVLTGEYGTPTGLEAALAFEGAVSSRPTSSRARLDRRAPPTSSCWARCPRDCRSPSTSGAGCSVRGSPRPPSRSTSPRSSSAARRARRERVPR